MLYVFNHGCWRHKHANKKVKPGFRNVQYDTSDYKYSGLLEVYSWGLISSVKPLTHCCITATKQIWNVPLLGKCSTMIVFLLCFLLYTAAQNRTYLSGDGSGLDMSILRNICSLHRCICRNKLKKNPHKWWLNNYKKYLWTDINWCCSCGAHSGSAA